MRYTILTVLFVAVSNAAPLDNPAEPIILTPAVTPIATSDISTTEKHVSMQNNLQQLPDQPINFTQVLEPPKTEDHPSVSDYAVEKPDNHLNNPESNVFQPISQPHYVEEHELHKEPNKPSLEQSTSLPGHNKPQEEYDSSDELNEDIAFLQTIGAIAVSLELAILEELEQAYEHHDHSATVPKANLAKH